MDDERFMREALALADKGKGQVSPNPMVGCVITKHGRVIGQGFHRRYGSCHAEVAAIADAGRKTQGATMYVTLQPCNHFGKTPPCTDAVIHSGVSRLVIAALDPNPGTMCDLGLAKIRKAGIRVKTGVCEPEAQRQNESYFHDLKYHRPFTALKLAATLDGMIADAQGRSKWISGPKSRAYVQSLRAQYDAVLVGAGTVAADDPRLTCRLPGRRQPVRVVLDHKLALSPGSRLLSCPGRTIVFCSERVPKRRQKRLASSKVEVVPIHEQKQDAGFWHEVLDALRRQLITSVLIEGGAGIAASALKAHVVSKLYLFLAPSILGRGKSFSAGLGAMSLDKAISVREWQTTRVGMDLLVQGYLSEA